MNNYDLMDKVLSNTNLTTEQQIKLIDELRKNNPTDRWSSRVAIWILGIAIIVTILCITKIILCNPDGNVPDGLIAIGSASVGGLAGLLSQNVKTND